MEARIGWIEVPTARRVGGVTLCVFGGFQPKDEQQCETQKDEGHDCLHPDAALVSGARLCLLAGRKSPLTYCDEKTLARFRIHGGNHDLLCFVRYRGQC